MKTKFILILAIMFAFNCKNEKKNETNDVDFEKVTKDDKAEAAKAVFNDDLNQIDYGQVELIDFTKTNGIERNYLGMNYYEIEFEANLKAVSSIDFYKHKSYVWRKLLTDYDINDLKKNKQLTLSTADKVKFPAGEIFKVNGSIFLEKTDNGWRKMKQ